MGFLNRWRLNGEIREQEMELAGKRLALESKMLESFDITTACVDPLDAIRDPETGELWDVLGATNDSSRLFTPAVLGMMRQASRRLANNNPFAINALENRINYIIGSGHSYVATAEPDSELAKRQQATKEGAVDCRRKRWPHDNTLAEYAEAIDVRSAEEDKQLAEVQAVIDRFIDVNDWPIRQQEITLRKDRDGECFLRFFESNNELRVRFVEPDQVATPAHDKRPFATFGIVTDPDDVETVESYWIDDEKVEASEIQHRKTNVDSNVKRGIPLLSPVRQNLKRTDTLLQNMSTVAGIQAAIALIRKHDAGTMTTQLASQSSNADVTVNNSVTGKTDYYTRYRPGTILDAPKGTDYDFPSKGIDASKLVLVIQAELRAIASRLVMPEFMLSSDASNANYASTMVAEGPSVKMFQRLQATMIQEDLDVMNRVLDMAVEAETITPELRAQVRIDVTPPQLASRNRKEEIEADTILVNNKAMSIPTLQLKNDLDPEHETELIDEQREKTKMKMDPFPLGGFRRGVQPEPEGGDDEDT